MVVCEQLTNLSTLFEWLWRIMVPSYIAWQHNISLTVEIVWCDNYVRIPQFMMHMRWLCVCCRVALHYNCDHTQRCGVLFTIVRRTQLCVCVAQHHEHKTHKYVVPNYRSYTHVCAQYVEDNTTQCVCFQCLEIKHATQSCVRYIGHTQNDVSLQHV